MSAQAPSYDFTSPAFLANPYPTWTQMRAEGPVYQDPVTGQCYVIGYEACLAVLHDLRFSSDRIESWMRQLGPEDRPRAAYYETMRRSMMHSVDPPDHTRLRRLVARAFTPRSAEAQRAHIQAVVDDLLASAPADDFDVIRDLAQPLPFYMIADMLGVPREDRALLRGWIDDFVPSFSALNPKIAEKADAACRAFADYLRPIVRRLRDASAHNLLSELGAIEEQGDRLSEQELFSTAMLLILAGNETTMHLIGNGLWLLLRHPEQLQMLHDDPALLGSAVEEMLRLENPNRHIVRVASEDLVLDGKTIRQGTRVNLMLDAANRDPAQFDDPDRFDITRQPNRHLSFGDYIHICLGAPLARVEAQVALGTMLQRYPAMRLLTTTPEWLPYFSFRGLRTLRIALDG